MNRYSPEYWLGRRVFVTGDMGFKGSWLCSLLSRLGASSVGFGRDDRPQLLYRELSIAGHRHVEGDINDPAALTQALVESGVEILFHLAAQPLVLASYDDPLGTFETNIMGTARVLEAARSAPDLQAIVVITSDKVYRNDNGDNAFAEDAPLGGADPYSASKAAAELVTAAMAASYFSRPGAPRIATARAGNVIGGGDWADNRLLPDAARALGAARPLVVRNPSSTRPWQHVLDPLMGYLRLAESLSTSPRAMARAWNFGPEPEQALTAGEVAELFVRAWGEGAQWRSAQVEGPQIKEAKHLAVDSTQSHTELGWQPRCTGREAVQRTAIWYRERAAGVPASMLVERDLDTFLSD